MKEPHPSPIHLVHPSTRHVSPTVKSFIEHVQEQMTPPPWQIGPVP
jgi:DNA-binding transcriptional LysR family regulator